MATLHYFHSNLRTLRAYHGQSQIDVARAIYTSRGAYAGWEQEVSEPSLEKLLALCHHFHISVGTLLLTDLASMNGFDLQRTLKSEPTPHHATV